MTRYYIILGIMLIGLAIANILICSKTAEVGTEYIKEVLSKPDQVIMELAPLSAKHKIDIFKATQGRLPKSLAELEESLGRLVKLPRGKKYQYNPTTGEITIVDDESQTTEEHSRPGRP